MQILRGPALQTVRAVLGLEGRGAQTTEYPDGILDQTLDTAPFIRRGLTRAASLGFTYHQITNIHGAGPSTVNSAFQPFGIGPGVTGWQDLWPGPVFPSDLYDAWLIYLGAECIANTGNLASFAFNIEPRGTLLVQGVAADMVPFPVYTGTVETVRAGRTILQANLPVTVRLPMRLHPDNLMFWATTTAGAPASEYSLTACIGLFPAGMQQDIISGGG